jgi:hypothetical protein
MPPAKIKNNVDTAVIFEKTRRKGLKDLPREKFVGYRVC